MTATLTAFLQTAIEFGAWTLGPIWIRNELFAKHSNVKVTRGSFPKAAETGLCER